MKYCLLIGWLFFSGFLHGQEGIKMNERMVMDLSNSPVVWIDSMKTDMAHLVMDKGAIDSLYVMKDSLASKKYSRVIAPGSLIIVPKTTVELVRWPAFLEQRGVPAKDRHLRVCINKTLVRSPTLLLLQPGFIQAIEVTSDRHWTYPEDAGSQELFLNIITKADPLHPLE